MINQPLLYSHAVIPLPHTGVCGILGITPQFDLYIEEIYPPDDDIICHHISTNGVIIQSSETLKLPTNIITPKIHPSTPQLNYTGGRTRGMREAEHLQDWAKPFTIAEKMRIIEALKLSITPMQLFGMINSVVLSSAQLHSDWFVVCRRIALAIALPKIQYDADGLPYDYDGHIIQTAHFYHASWEESPPIESVLMGIGDIRLSGTYDCVLMDNQLLISESGIIKNNTIHQWSIAHPT